MIQILRCLLLLFSFTFILAVDKNNFKSCDQSSFCRRLRGAAQDNSKFVLNLDTLLVSDHSVEIDLKNIDYDAEFKFIITSLDNDIFRLTVDEIKPLLPRYRVQGVLNGDPQITQLEILERNKEKVVIQSRQNKAIIYGNPLKIEFYKNGILVAVINKRGLFNIEHLRTKPIDSDELAKEDPGAWEENFKSHHDSKPRGPEAVGCDITFPGALRAYGIPQHADRLALRTTGPGGLDPYRLYNLDVFEYEVDSTMAIYGSIPVLYAHSLKHSVGIFWLNAAETWVDITNSKDSNVVSSIVNLVSGHTSEDKVDVHFMSESGILDLFVLMGPEPKDVVTQYASLTGVAPLPQYYTLAYHQSRWNYIDQDDVLNVVDNFDKYDLPVDTIWLDIEYTDGKKYFTWDPIKFSQPEAMINNLTLTGRHLIIIIDPHIKREAGYFLHEDALANDYYVKTKDGKVYEGWCWPGSSSYIDFLNPHAVEYFKHLYELDKFKGTTKEVQIWNDMNEPSVFNGPEITMPKDCLHYGNWEHRHVHNIVGLLYTSVTYQALLHRSSDRRPFILTRAHFAGSQRTAALWTGDNNAEWSHLQASFPMCLSEAIAGMSFCGADIGGFFNNPDTELLQRWYQAAVWLPFFRAHAHIDTRRREPYLFSEDVRSRIGNALRLRYAFLPLWYTLFREHELTGEPVIRPLFYQYPDDSKALDIDNQLLVGNYILARPVMEAGVSSVSIYLPGGANELWYDIEDYKQYKGVGEISIPVTLEKNPAFYRGGAIVPRKDRPRRASTLTHNDPFTLYVALDNNQSAKGTLYIDDGQTFEYRNKKYIYQKFEFSNNVLESSSIDNTNYPTKEWIERIVILGIQTGIKGATIESRSLNAGLQTSYDGENRSLTIRKPGVNVGESFKIVLK